MLFLQSSLREGQSRPLESESQLLPPPPITDMSVLPRYLKACLYVSATNDAVTKTETPSKFVMHHTYVCTLNWEIFTTNNICIFVN